LPFLSCFLFSLSLSLSFFFFFFKKKSGPALAAWVPEGLGGGATVAVTACVPDDVQAIQRVLMQWCDVLQLSLVLTTGGTGMAPRDVTPEAVRPLLHREAPALSQTMLLRSLSVTPMAMLSRSVCGMRASTLIVTLPGSRKAALECAGFLQPALPHALDLLADRSSSVAATHVTVQSSGTLAAAAAPPPSTASTAPAAAARPRHHDCQHHHQHHHEHHQHPPQAPTTGSVADRARTSKYPMVPMDQATQLVLDRAAVLGSQTVALSDALGCVLGHLCPRQGMLLKGGPRREREREKKGIIGERKEKKGGGGGGCGVSRSTFACLIQMCFLQVALPPFPASVKDGYAVIAAECPGVLEVSVAPVTAGAPGAAQIRVTPGLELSTHTQNDRARQRGHMHFLKIDHLDGDFPDSLHVHKGSTARITDRGACAGGR
jgi:gephyrin